MTKPTRLSWLMLCDYFLVDHAGKHSYLGVFDRIGALSFPAVHKSVYVAVALEGEPNTTASGLLDIWAPDGALVVSTEESRLQFPATGRTIFINLLYDLRLPSAGAYNITIEVGGKPVGRGGFEVYSAAPPSA